MIRGALALLAFGLVLAGCGGSGKALPRPAPEPGPGEDVRAVPGAPARTDEARKLIIPGLAR